MKSVVRIWVGVVAAIAAVVAAGAGVWQAMEAGRAGDATEDTNRISRTTSARPHIVATDPLIERRVDGQLEVGIKFENVGQVPAHNLRANLAIEIREHPLRGDIEPHAWIVDATVVGKTLALSKIEPRRFTGEELKVIESARGQRLYLRGHACYVDAFKNHYHLSFCFSYLGEERFGLCEGNRNGEDEAPCPAPPPNKPPGMLYGAQPVSGASLPLPQK